MITREMKVNIREFDLATKIPMFPTSHSTPMLSSTPTTPQLTSLRSRMSPHPTMNCDTRDTITRETRDLSMPHPSSIDWHRQDWGQQDKETRTWWPIFLPTAKYIKTKRVQEVLLEVMQVSADGERFLPTPAPPCPWFISASAIHERSGLVQQLRQSAGQVQQEVAVRSEVGQSCKARYINKFPKKERPKWKSSQWSSRT